MRRYIQRSHVREKVDITARLIVRTERLTIIHCHIVDRSEGGMKVVMKDAYSLPDKVFILGDESDHLYECEKRWQNQGEVGLMLIDICMNSVRREILAQLPEGLVFDPPTEDGAAIDES